MTMSFGHLMPAGLPVVFTIAADTASAATSVNIGAFTGDNSGFNISVIKMPAPCGDSKLLPLLPLPASCCPATTSVPVG